MADSDARLALEAADDLEQQIVDADAGRLVLFSGTREKFQSWIAALRRLAAAPSGDATTPTDDDEVWAAYRAGYLNGVSEPKAQVEGYEAWCAHAEAGASAYVAILNTHPNEARKRWNAASRSSGSAAPQDALERAFVAGRKAMASPFATCPSCHAPAGAGTANPLYRDEGNCGECAGTLPAGREAKE